MNKESNLKNGHNNKLNSIKKHVKFAKSSKLTMSMTTSGRNIQSASSSSKFAMKSSKKIKKFSTKDNKMTSAVPIVFDSAAAAMQQPFYYYYYYPEETISTTAAAAISDEQQQQYFYANNNNNNYYYYAIDGTSDVNYNPEFFIQPTATGNHENYMR